MLKFEHFHKDLNRELFANWSLKMASTMQFSLKKINSFRQSIHVDKRRWLRDRYLQLSKKRNANGATNRFNLCQILIDLKHHVRLKKKPKPMSVSHRS